MEKNWFVLHTLTGQENKAQKSIEARVKLERMDEYVGKCVIPTERVTEKKNGKKRTITKKFFPGYVLCELALYDEAKGVDENGKKAIYEQTEPWKSFVNIVEYTVDSIEEIDAEGGFTIGVEGSRIVVNGAGDAKVEVFNTNGAAVYCGVADNMPELAADIYIVRVGSTIKKVAVAQ